MNPAVSVIIPTYNRAHSLPAAIESVLAQTYSDLELIVFDDGSSDDTKCVVRKYAASENLLTDKIRYFHQENRGKSVALNEAVAQAKGEWIAILDSDDVWLPDKLEQQFEVLARYPECGLCFADCQFVNNPEMDTTFFRHFGASFADESGKLRAAAKFLLQTPCASIITVVCRTELARRIGGFDPELRFTEDYDFMFRMALETEFCFVNLVLALADRAPLTERHRGTAAQWDQVEFRLRSEQYRYEKWLALGQRLTPGLRRTIIGRIAATHSAWANRYLTAGDYERARSAAAAAMRYQLRPGVVAKWALTLVCPSLMKSFAQARGLFPEIAD